MQTGTCALCRAVGKLHDSHFLPKSVYRLLRRSNNGNLSPVLMSPTISIQTDYQMKQPLLCSACEGRFSQNGENYVVPLLNNGRSFPLLDRLKLALPFYTTATNTAFVCPAVGLSGEKIGYLGLSILWRAAVRTWRMFERRWWAPAPGTTRRILIADQLSCCLASVAGNMIEAALHWLEYLDGQTATAPDSPMP